MVIESFCRVSFSFLPDIFIQQCHLLRQSGHSEKAISLFQAMIDFTFFKPDSVRQLSTKQQVNTRTDEAQAFSRTKYKLFDKSGWG